MNSRNVNKETGFERGQSVVEFALVLPILLALLYGVIEFGRLVILFSSVQTAGREAARWAVSTELTANNIPRYKDFAAIKQRAVDSAPFAGLQTSQVQVYYDKGPEDPNPRLCPDYCTTDPEPGDRIRVVVNTNFLPVVPIVNVPPVPVGVDAPRTIVRAVVPAGASSWSLDASPTSPPNPPTSTNTPVGYVPPTATNTPVGAATATNTVAVPPTATNTLVPPTATNTLVPPTATNTPVPPTASPTPKPIDAIFDNEPAQPVCIYDPVWQTISGWISLPTSIPSARLQLSYYVVFPSNKATSTIYVDYGIVHDGDRFSMQIYWPGISPGDTVVENHAGSMLLDVVTGNPIMAEGGSVDYYWYPWVCVTPTPTNPANPTATKTVNPGPTSTPIPPNTPTSTPVMNCNNLYLTGGSVNKKVYTIQLNNTDPTKDVTIQSIYIRWAATTSNIQSFTYNGSSVWTGPATGGQWTLVNFSGNMKVTHGQSPQLIFNTSVNNTVLTYIQIGYSDSPCQTEK